VHARRAAATLVPLHLVVLVVLVLALNGDASSSWRAWGGQCDLACPAVPSHTRTPQSTPSNTHARAGARGARHRFAGQAGFVGRSLPLNYDAVTGDLPASISPELDHIARHQILRVHHVPHAVPPHARRAIRVRCVSIFRDKNRRYIGKSQPKRPPKRTQRTPHLEWRVSRWTRRWLCRAIRTFRAPESSTTAASIPPTSSQLDHIHAV
jgi:hypothetical protein